MDTKSLVGIVILLAVVVGGIFLADVLKKRA